MANKIVRHDMREFGPSDAPDSLKVKNLTKYIKERNQKAKENRNKIFKSNIQGISNLLYRTNTRKMFYFKKGGGKS